MYSNKLSPQVQLALKYENLFISSVKEQFVVNASQNIWEVIVEYINSLADAPVTFAQPPFILNSNFALVQIQKEDIMRLAQYPNVIKISFTTVMSYIDINIDQICATNIANPQGAYNLTGRGILVGIIDTGIRYEHPDFITTSGTTRIRYLWDQTIVGLPPQGFRKGTEYTFEIINRALSMPTSQEQLSIVPSQDTIGHGTAIAGIAAGNGRASNNQFRGVASEAELIIVKIGPEGGNSEVPIDRDIMLGIKYVLAKAAAENKPVSILLGSGSNIGGHDGEAILERYIAEVSNAWPCNFVVGTGNQGNKASHASGILNNEETQIVQLFIDSMLLSYQCTLWKDFVDRIELIVESPRGEQTESLSILTPNRAFVFGNTVVLVNFSLANINNTKQEIFIWFQAASGMGIDRGIWTILLRGLEILNGAYNMWGSIIETVSNQTRFLAEDPAITLTIPSTSENITSVAAFNATSMQIAAFSGRGYTAINKIKPDLTAPGVSVMAASIKENIFYEPVSGTSAAAAFVAGAFAVLLQYSVTQLGEQFLYGQSLKLYLLRNAKRPPSYAPYPNSQWGYGILCVEAALNNMRESLPSLSQG